MWESQFYHSRYQQVFLPTVLIGKHIGYVIWHVFDDIGMGIDCFFMLVNYFSFFLLWIIS